MQAVVPRRSVPAALAQVPALFAPNQRAAKRFLEYFAANIRNANTRRAYVRAILALAVIGAAELLAQDPDEGAAVMIREPLKPKRVASRLLVLDRRRRPTVHRA
jgi:hypothetical protein